MRVFALEHHDWPDNIHVEHIASTREAALAYIHARRATQPDDKAGWDVLEWEIDDPLYGHITCFHYDYLGGCIAEMKHDRHYYADGTKVPDQSDLVQAAWDDQCARDSGLI